MILLNVGECILGICYNSQLSLLKISGITKVAKFFYTFLSQQLRATINSLELGPSWTANVYVLVHVFLAFNPVVTSWTYMSHLQKVFSSPTFSPCCHLPWSISIPLKQSECIFPRNSRLQMIMYAMLLCSIAHSIICTRENAFWLVQRNRDTSR